MTPDQKKAIDLLTEAATLLGWAIAMVPGPNGDISNLSAIMIGKLDVLGPLGEFINQ